MNEYDDILNRIVEEFYDTGKLVLNEFTTNSPEMSNLRNGYYKILSGEGNITIVELFDKWYNLNDEQQKYFEDINDLFDFETKLEFLSKNIVLIKEITNTFNRYKDIDFLKELKDVKILYDLRGKILDKFLDEDIKEFLPDKIISLIDDKIKEVESVELIPHETSVTQEINRLNQVEEDNNSDLALLSIDTPIDTDSEKSNLMTLQNLLLNKYDQSEYYRKGLEEEKKEGKFGEFTKFYVQLLQEENSIETSGMVNRSVWNLVLGLISNRENEKLNDLGVSNELKDILSFQYGRDINNKQKLNKLSSLELFNNLVGFGIYKIEHGVEHGGRNDDGLLEKLESMALSFDKSYADSKKKSKKFKKSIEDLEEGLKDINKTIADLKKMRQNRSGDNFNVDSFFKRYLPVKELMVKKKKIVKDIQEYKRFESIIRKYIGGGKLKVTAIEEYLDIRKKTDERTVKGLFGGLKKVFDEAVKFKDYSLDAINSILTNINLIMKKNNESDIQQTTKNNKSKKVLRSIMDKVDNTMDVEDIQDVLDNVNTKTFQHVKYELSFCECRNDDDEMLRPYFRDCGSSIGNTSRLISGGNTPLKELIDSTDDVEECVTKLYDVIILGIGRKIVKHDIVANIDINLTEGFTINTNSTIEVKRVSREKVGSDGFTLSEFFSLFKNEPDRSIYKTPQKYNKYNDIIGGLVNRLNSGDDGNEILNEYSNTSGIFLKDYIYYEKGTDEIIDNSYNIEWSTNSDRSQLKSDKLNVGWMLDNPNYVGEMFREDEKRLTVKFKINGEGYKWEEGNCNIEGEQPTNESTDRIDNIIENFFDTGNFDI